MSIDETELMYKVQLKLLREDNEYLTTEVKYWKEKALNVEKELNTLKNKVYETLIKLEVKV